MSESSEEVKERIKEILLELSEEERNLLDLVVKAERQKIHMQRAHGIYDDIQKAIEQAIQ